MILHQEKFIYSHIPKTGGRSVEAAFAFDPVPRVPIDDPFEVQVVEKETEKHLPAVLLQRSFPDVFQSYFKAWHVRNSWDLVVSAYFWLKPGCNLRREFKEWVMNRFADTPTRETNIFIKPCQLDWISDENGLVIVDFVGRFESLKTNFEYICETIGATGKTLPHLNKTNHLHYSRYYDDETKEYIAELYRIDIDYFRFKFEER